jgi:hypothetical protein
VAGDWKLKNSQPPAMLAEIERVRKAEHRTRSELSREAFRAYFASRLKQIAPTAA